uniref:Putative secreted protein n=1 Tax=Ixodes ricinus TaxID=34613 RepID=A0A6B0UIM1_IXORI
MAARLFVLFNMFWWFCLDSNSLRQTVVTGTAPPWSVVRQYGFAFFSVRIALHIIGVPLLFLVGPPQGYLELIWAKKSLVSAAPWRRCRSLVDGGEKRRQSIPTKM